LPPSTFISANLYAVVKFDLSVGSPLSTLAGGVVRMRRMIFLARAPELAGRHATVAGSRFRTELFIVSVPSLPPD
jgi:hypothetical protein